MFDKKRQLKAGHWKSPQTCNHLSAILYDIKLHQNQKIRIL